MDYHTNLRTNTSRLHTRLIEGLYRPSAPARLLREKSKGLCRQIVLPSIDDSIVLQRLSDSFFFAIRGKTPSPNAYFEPDNFVFSTRDRGLYGSFAAWLHFHNKLIDISNISDYVVVTDIANYYDHISYDNLRNIISTSISVSETVLDLLIFILSELSWQPDYMPRIPIGLPQIDLDAPRVLAHAFLFDLDKYAISKVGDKYTRYIDDINFGTESIAEAKGIIRDVDILLHARQVRLNSGKTNIFTAAGAQNYLRVSDHRAVDSLLADLAMRRATGSDVSALGSRIESEIRTKYRNGDFDVGHGDKVLKRYISLAKDIGAGIHADILRDCLRRRPSCRESVLSYIATRPLDRDTIVILDNFVRFPELVDDVSILLAAKALVGMQATARSVTRSHLVSMASWLATKGPWGLYGGLWMLSKYGTNGDLLNLLVARSADCFAEPLLARLAGALYQRFQGSPEAAEYNGLVVGSGSPAALAAMRFQRAVVSSNTAALSIRPFISAPNPSLSTGLLHSKFLLLLGVLRNEAVSLGEKRRLIARHPMAWRDAFYRSLAIEAAPHNLRSRIV